MVLNGAVNEAPAKTSWKANESWLASGLGILLPLVGAPLAFEMYSVMIQSPQPAGLWGIKTGVWFAIGVVATLAGVLVAVLDQSRQRAAIEAGEAKRAQSVTRFTDELGSTLDVLIDYSQSDGQRKSSDALIKNVLREGRRLYAHAGVRLCLYMLETTEAENPVDSKTYLVLREYDGRRDAPRAEFATGAHSDSLIAIAKGNRAVAVTDTKKLPSGVTAVDHDEHSGWSSFLAIPLIRGRDNVGVLLIDTRNQTRFMAEDKSIGWTLSRLLVHGLRATERQAQDVASDRLRKLLGQFGVNQQVRQADSVDRQSTVDPDEGEGTTSG